VVSDDFVVKYAASGCYGKFMFIKNEGQFFEQLMIANISEQPGDIVTNYN